MQVLEREYPKIVVSLTPQDMQEAVADFVRTKLGIHPRDGDIKLELKEDIKAVFTHSNGPLND